MWDAHPEAMRSALATHDELLNKAVETHDGRIFKHTGDGIAAAFAVASDAIYAAADAQRAMAAAGHPDVGVLRIRAAVHSGEAEERDDDFFGPPLNRVARLLSAAHGGQVLVSLVTERLSGTSLREDLSLVDLGEHRLRDLTQPERVFQLTGADLVSDFPDLLTPDIVPNNLPTMTTSFVGRDQELAEVEKLIRGARLVTITGVGGAGKTRLALQTAASFGDEFPDGIWLVELAAITDPSIVPSATASALNVGEQAGRSIVESLIDYLSARTALIIIDNCEHVITEAADLVDAILKGAPDCTVVTTSRELLGVGGEVAFGMRSMSLPESDDQVDVAELGRYDAVRLFMERAAASQPGLRIGSDNAAAVSEICRRLDGMPLAVELAAARLRSFSPQQIAEHLDQRFRLLTGGSRTALPRQQTLSAAIDWSYQLLEPIERLLFEKLSVFQGGFTLAAAEQVCVDQSLDGFDVLELIPSLVDKSLVAAETHGHEVRYRMLETIRQFARDLLDKSGDADEVRRTHAGFFLELAEAAEPHVRGADEQMWWDRIDADLDNLRQAMLWSLEANEPEIGMRIAGAIWRFWWFKVRFSEGISWLERILATGENVADHTRAKALLGLGTLNIFVNQTEQATELLEQSLGLYRRLDADGVDQDLLRYGYSAALINLGEINPGEGDDAERSLRLNEEALEVARRIDDPAGVAVALGNIAEYYGRIGEYEDARERFRAAVAASEKLESAHRLHEQNWQLGQFELAANEPELAIDAFTVALGHAERGGLSEYAAYDRTQIAVARHDAGDDSEALASFIQNATEALENEDMRKFAWMRAGWLVQRADLELAVGNSEDAAVMLGAMRAMEESGPILHWVHFERRDRVLAALADALGEEATQATMDRGEALESDDVIELIIQPV